MFIHALFTHDLPGDVPLPNQAHFVKMEKNFKGEANSTAWIYTVSQTKAAQVGDFFRQQLPAQGWSRVVGGNSGLVSFYFACKAPYSLQIPVSDQLNIEGVVPPPDGAVFGVMLYPIALDSRCK